MRTISSLEKGLQLLEHIAHQGSVRIAETAKRFDMSNSSMSIFMNTLVASGLVYKDEMQKRYYISTGINKLAEAAEKHFSELIESLAREEMTELHQTFNENVMLAVISGTRSRYISRIQSNHLIQIVEDDMSYPLHATANGKVMLAFKDSEFVRKYMGAVEWKPFTSKTITNPKDLEKELERIRASGYAVNRGEYETNIMAIAAPIESPGGIVASIVVQYPTFRHDESELETYAPTLVSLATRISRKLQLKV